MKKWPFAALALLLTAPCFAQSWTSVLSPARAINWADTSGLPATLPDGETTPNPWTPPTRTQCGSTVAAGTSAATVLSDASTCANGTYLLLGPGSFNWASTSLLLGNVNEITIRGSGAGGANQTTINISGTTAIQLGEGNGSGSCAVTSFPNSTSFTCALFTGVTLTTGNIVTLFQCNTGTSGAGCGTGTQTDNGGVFVCSASACAQQVGGGTSNPAQQQIVHVTAVSGSGPYTVTFSPALAMPNWSTSNSPTAQWQNASYNAVGLGLEDMTINNTSTANPAILISNGYASWFKGLRVIGNNANSTIKTLTSVNCLIANNYFHFEKPGAIDGTDGINLLINSDTAMLVLNNITDTGDALEGDGEIGTVIAYNFSRDGNTTYIQDSFFEHAGSSSFVLMEGNQTGVTEDDDTWATHDFNTWFRNHVLTTDPPYAYPTNNGLPRGILVDSFSRGASLIGNAVGTNSTLTPSYESTVSSPLSFGYEFGFYANVSPSDTLTQSSAMLWGNCDVVNATCRNNSAEVPTSLTGSAAVFNNTASGGPGVPANNNLPCSFFLAGYTSTTCSSHANGGTGLSWWKVCTSWTTFPISCSATTLQPFPPVGPDISSGSYVLGHAYDIPAEVADKNLPVDTSLQNSYSITGSSWSAGTEKLTVSSLPNLDHLMGRFQISGGACATSGAGTPSGAEVVITASTSTTISYSLASNPGTCTGTMLFPDVRQFDERVYENDPASSNVMLSCVTTNFGNITVGQSSVPSTCTLTNNSASSATSLTISNTTGNTGDFSIGSNTCTSTLAASSSCTFTETFTPTTTGARATDATATYSGGDGASPQTVALSGTGVAATATGSVLNGTITPGTVIR